MALSIRFTSAALQIVMEMGRGDLLGVVQKLDYIASLGVDAVWISPFFPSPMKDGGYDISDYCAIAPQFGTLADFQQLLNQAHAILEVAQFWLDLGVDGFRLDVINFLMQDLEHWLEERSR
ncbi:MAG: alpha-amylase family glycosyl hydrolase [Coleofasciculus sp. G3-WIS-01]